MKIVWEDSENHISEKTKAKLEKEVSSLVYEIPGDDDSEGIIVCSLLQLAEHLGALDYLFDEFALMQQQENPEEYFKNAWWRSED